MVVTAGFVRLSRGPRSIQFFSDTELHLRVRNISRAPIQNICYSDSLLFDQLRSMYKQNKETW